MIYYRIHGWIYYYHWQKNVTKFVVSTGTVEHKMTKSLLQAMKKYYLEYEPDDAENCLCPKSFCT